MKTLRIIWGLSFIITLAFLFFIIILMIWDLQTYVLIKKIGFTSILILITSSILLVLTKK